MNRIPFNRWVSLDLLLPFKLKIRVSKGLHFIQRLVPQRRCQYHILRLAKENVAVPCHKMASVRRKMPVSTPLKVITDVNRTMRNCITSPSGHIVLHLAAHKREPIQRQSHHLNGLLQKHGRRQLLVMQTSRQTCWNASPSLQTKSWRIPRSVWSSICCCITKQTTAMSPLESVSDRDSGNGCKLQLLSCGRI